MLSQADNFRQKLKSRYKSAPLDIASFLRHYKACGMNECYGLCCNGGTSLYIEEEKHTISKLVEENRGFFNQLGLPMPAQIFEEEADAETGEINYSTTTRETIYPEGILPPHFPATACIFRGTGGACSLQMLSTQKGHDSWHYKPFACWLYPIELEHGGQPHIRVAHHSTDEYVDETYPGFVGFTPCGSECSNGKGTPAYQILEREIAALSSLLERDLMAEILKNKPATAG